MKKFLFALGVTAMAAALLTSASAANRGIEFTPMGFLPDLPPEVIPYSWPTTLSFDGQTVSGSPSPFGGCMLWREGEGWSEVSLDNTSSCYMSRDGSEILASRVLNEGGFEVSAVWNGTSWDILDAQDGNAPCDFNQHGTFAISDDGSTIAGLTWAGCGWARGYTWTADGGMIPKLGILDDSSRVNGLNSDGSIAVGWNRVEWGGWQATRWLGDVPEWVVPESEDYFIFEAWSTNSDGSVVTGAQANLPPSDANPFGNPEGWVWHEGQTEVTGTGIMPWAWFTDQGFAFDSSEDGSVVVGRFGFGPFSVATMWTEETGLLDLNQFLIDQGSTAIFDGWNLVQVNSITPDGTRMVGCGANPDAMFGCNEAWMLDISKISVCHAPPGNPDNARTLNIAWDSMGDHMAHGDFLGTCEAAGGGFSRAQNPHERFGLTNENIQRTIESHTPGYSSFEAGPTDVMRFQRSIMREEATPTRVRQPVRQRSGQSRTR